MIEDLKQIRDILNDLLDWEHPDHEKHIKAIDTLDRIILETTDESSNMAVPDGYKLVPIEPTEPMIMAGIYTYERNYYLPKLGTRSKSVGVYKAMISHFMMPQQGKVGTENATPQPDLTKCPKCGGIADNGIDRYHPPNPYNCKKCGDIRMAGTNDGRKE